MATPKFDLKFQLENGDEPRQNLPQRVRTHFQSYSHLRQQLEQPNHTNLKQILINSRNVNNHNHERRTSGNLMMIAYSLN
jgi:hypothetical protein